MFFGGSSFFHFISFQKREGISQWVAATWQTCNILDRFYPFMMKRGTKQKKIRTKKRTRKLSEIQPKKKLSPKRFFVYSLIFFNGCFGKAAILLILFYLAVI